MNLTNIYNKGRLIYLFLRDNNGKLTIKETNELFPYYYSVDNYGQVNSWDGKKLRKIMVSDPRQISKARHSSSYEADIKLPNRYMIDKIDELTKCPIKTAFIDIEVQTDELPDVDKALCPITCISVGNSFTKEIKTFWTLNYNTEFELIEDFIGYMKREKFDLWLSWNVKFDYNYLFNRYPEFADKISIIGENRYGKEVLFPAGISIVDYLSWFQKITLNKEQEYSLDYIAQKYLKGKTWGKTDFNKVTEDIRLKNINDVKRMMKLEEMFNIIGYFDEVRRLAKVEWEDLIFNSRTLDMLLLQEAKNQGIALSMKPSEIRGTLEDKAEYEGAYREAYETGRFENITKYDLSSAYPSAIIDFCLDPSNIVEKGINKNIPIVEIETTAGKEQIIDKTQMIEEGGLVTQIATPAEITYFQQNFSALLPTVVKKLLVLKNNIKSKLEKLSEGTLEYKNTETFYKAIKGIVNSAYGVFGNRFFRMYNKNVASATTYIVRTLLQHVKEQIELQGYKVIYADTDSLFVDSPENITQELNNIISRWYLETYNKYESSIEFAYEGKYQKLLILSKCRYYGILEKPNGDIKTEICGIEMKRKDSTRYMKEFQEILIKKILNKEEKESIFTWIKEEIKNLPQRPLIDIALPCKISKKLEDYKSVPIFVRALGYAQALAPDFKKKLGDRFYYLFIEPKEYEDKEISRTIIKTWNKAGLDTGFKNLTEKRLEKACELNLNEEQLKSITLAKEMNNYNIESTKELLEEKGILKVETIMTKGKAKNVMAFDSENMSHVKNIDWKAIIQRNIIMKLETIFTAMKYDIKKVIIENNTSIKLDIIKKDEVEEYIKKLKTNNKCGTSVEVARSTSSGEGKVQVLSSAPKNESIIKSELLKKDNINSSINSQFDKIQKEKSKIKEIENFNLKDLKIKEIDYSIAKQYIKENHYSHTLGCSIKLSLGFYYKNELVTAIIYGDPVGINAKSFLQCNSDQILELVRLFSKDGLPKNTESYCISQSFKYIKANKPNFKYLLSYADSNHGHVGYIYQATNWIYIGLSSKDGHPRIFIDKIEVHPRSMYTKHGTSSIKKLKEIYKDRLQTKKKNQKYVYIMCLGNKKEKREWYLKFTKKAYPKIKDNLNG